CGSSSVGGAARAASARWSTTPPHPPWSADYDAASVARVIPTGQSEDTGSAADVGQRDDRPLGVRVRPQVDPTLDRPRHLVEIVLPLDRVAPGLELERPEDQLPHGPLVRPRRRDDRVLRE